MQYNLINVYIILHMAMIERATEHFCDCRRLLENLIKLNTFCVCHLVIFRVKVCKTLAGNWTLHELPLVSLAVKLKANIVFDQWITLNGRFRKMPITLTSSAHTEHTHNSFFWKAAREAVTTNACVTMHSSWVDVSCGSFCTPISDKWAQQHWMCVR